MDSFLESGTQGEAKFHLLLQDECESLDCHCVLPDVLDLTPPFADDLACSDF